MRNNDFNLAENLIGCDAEKRGGKVSAFLRASVFQKMESHPKFAKFDLTPAWKIHWNKTRRRRNASIFAEKLNFRKNVLLLFLNGLIFK